MFKFKKKRESYRFSDKVHPIQGIASFVMGVLLIIGMLFLCVFSSYRQGALLTGFFGLLIFFGSIGGEILAITGIRREDIHYRFPILGILLNGFILVVCIGLYLVGITLGA